MPDTRPFEPPRVGTKEQVPQPDDRAGTFDLPEGEGTTESERFLARLCRRSFLRLWSFPNTYTSEGMHEGSFSGKEFSDVLVVFGDDVLLFSDKDISFNDHLSIDVSWARWFKKAVTKSARQLYGALSWAKQFPDRIFLDAACKRPLPIDLPPPERARYHLIATTRGTFGACSKAFPGSIGSHQINTGIVGAAHLQAPFTVGILEPNKHFVHVFDEHSLDVVMKERDTAADFIKYLSARQAFIADGGRLVIAAGEEQLLAAYMTTMRANVHSFLSAEQDAPGVGIVVFDETLYPAMRANPQYRAKKLADAKSYQWDKLIENFIELGDPALAGKSYSNRESERALRVIASEDRFNRRLLVEALTDLVNGAARKPTVRIARLYATEQSPHIAYTFLVMPRRGEDSYQDYRAKRSRLLQLYCMCGRLRRPSATTFVGIAFDHPSKDYVGGSEDLVTYQWDKDAVPDINELRRVADAAGIISNKLKTHHFHSSDFPAATRVKPTAKGNKKSKHKNAMAKRSRRLNRKKR